jgi:hypothetical protein
MKRKFIIYFAFIVLTASCKKVTVDELSPIPPDNSNLNVPVTNFPFNGLSSDSNTSTSLQQLFVIIGNSLARGRSEKKGPTPKKNTVFEWAECVTRNK